MADTETEEKEKEKRQSAEKQSVERHGVRSMRSIHSVEKRGMLVCFSTDSDKFKSNYERNKFFRGLYGWKQVVEKDGKRYVYERRGVLGGMPHKKIDQSSFIVEDSDFDRIEEFFGEWQRKVVHNTFKVLLEKNIINELEEMREEMEKIRKRMEEEMDETDETGW